MTCRIAVLIPVAGASLLLCSCGGDFLSKLNEPLPGGGNALDPPGYNSNPVQVVEVTGPTYAPGEWVETSVPQAALYRRQPKAGDQPVRNLPQGTDLKVVSTSGTYVKAELESGEVGYVPAIMVSPKRSATEIPIVPIGPSEPSGPVEFPPPSPYDAAPEPEVPPISVEEALGVPSLIDPEDDPIE